MTMPNKRGRKPKPAAESSPTECLRERVNIGALWDVASRELAARWRPQGRGPVLRAGTSPQDGQHLVDVAGLALWPPPSPKPDFGRWVGMADVLLV